MGAGANRVTDPDGNALTLSLLNLPRYASFTDHGDGSGVLHIAPGQRDRGNVVITVKASDDGDGEGAARTLMASTTFVLTVPSIAEPPLLEPLGNKVALIGQTINFIVRASDLDQDPLSFTVSGASASASLTPGIYGAALFSWTPTVTDAGPHSLSFTVADSTGLGNTQTIQINVRASNAALSSPAGAPTGRTRTRPLALA